jgi:hypothetical protein
MNKREQILTLLRAHIAQRPGLEFGNYGDVKAYRAEMRSITKDRHHAEQLLRRIELSSISEEKLREAFCAFSGRLSLSETADGKLRLDYCTGQYFPTEYRKAACAVLASALWGHYQDNTLLPNVTTDRLRATFRREFGRTITQRYFN